MRKEIRADIELTKQTLAEARSTNESSKAHTRAISR
jgi:hypothetical protein